MSTVRLRIDVSGTIGDQAWRTLQQFDPIQKAAFGPQFGSSGPEKHPPTEPHAKGDPYLITLKGLDAMAKADVVVYDALIDPLLLEFSATAKPAIATCPVRRR